MKNNCEFVYHPIDINPNVLENIELKLPNENLVIESLNIDYSNEWEQLFKYKNERKIVLFLGSDIGNLDLSEMVRFFRKIQNLFGEEDLILTGFDLKKNPEIIKNAYDDKEDITKELNLNLLSRINRELNANFTIGNFNHYSVYMPDCGEAMSYLISNTDQQVYIEKLDEVIKFKKWEPILTEVSRKFGIQTIEMLAKQSGFKIKKNFIDNQRYFVDSLWELDV